MIWIDMLLAGGASLYAAVLLWVTYHWHRMPRVAPLAASPPARPFSIVVAARNEAARISQLLDSLAGLHYAPSHWELIVVDDHSDDSTQAVVSAWAAAHPGVSLRLFSLRDPQSAGKKAAQAYGVRQAHYDWIVVVDADCWAPPNWLRCFDTFLQQHPQAVFVAGPVGLAPAHTAFTRWQALEFAGLLVAGAVSFRRQGAYCSAANMAFSRSAYEAVWGRRSDLGQASGDDVFLLHALNARYPGQTHFMKAPEATVWSLPQEKFSGWWMQRLRWASKNLSVGQRNTSLGATLVWLLMTGLLLRSLMAAAGAGSWLLALAWLLKVGGEATLLHAGSRWMAPPGAARIALAAQAFQTAYIAAMGLLAPWAPFSWKKRRYGPAGRAPADLSSHTKNPLHRG